MRGGPRYRRLYSGSGLAWASQYIALDGTRPAIIADFNRGLYAVPVGLTSITAGSAGIDQLTRLRAASFDEVFAFTATSTTARSYLDQDGTRRNDLSANVPRFAFDNGKRQLQLENQIANLLLWTSFDGALPTSWTAPIGTGSRSLTTQRGLPAIRFTGTAERPYLNQGVTLTASTTYTLSALVTNNGGSTPVNAVITYSDFGSATNVSGTGLAPAAGVTARVSVTFTTAADNVGNIQIGLGSGGADTGDVTISEVQLEAQSFASAYIPTTTATVTRAIETCQVSALTQALVSRAACTIAVRGRLSNTGTAARALFGNDSSGTLLFAQTSSQTVVANFNGISTVSTTLGSGAFNTAAFGAALAFDATGRAVCANGGAVGSDASAVGTKTVTYLGRSPGSFTYGDGFYDALVIYPARVTSGALQALAVAA